MKAPAKRTKPAAVADREIDLWWIESPDEARSATLATCLSPAERKRLARMRIAARRREFTIGRAALRHILARYLGQSPADIEITVSANGKPALADGRLQFSMAHSRGRIAIAVAAKGAVGVDIEAARDLHRPARLAETLLSDAALAAWRTLPAARQIGPLLHAWTAMESVIKALGRSLPGALRSVRIDGAGSEWPTLAAIDGQAARARGWIIVHVNMPDRYIGALAHRGAVERVNLHKFRWAAARRAIRAQKR